MRRLNLKVGAEISVAVAIAVVVGVAVVTVFSVADRNGHHSASPAARPATSPSAATIEAAAFMIKAAGSAVAQGDVEPKPDQFLYVQQTGYQAWLSIDGTHDGLIDNGDKTADPGCRDGVQLVAGNYEGVRPQPCTPDPAYVADAPTTAAAMAKYVLAQAGSNSPNNIGKEVLNLAGNHYLRPAAQAALYEATRLLAGLTLSATTVTNRNTNAVAITWSFNGEQSVTLLFDPTNYTFLGCVNSLADAHGANSYRQGIVDAVGQLP